MKLRIGCVFVAFLSVVLSMAAQTSVSSSAVQVPPVIQFSNVANDEGGNPLSGEVNITFALYNNAQGGEPLWSETQKITLGSSGQYSVYLGITKANGLPSTLFTSGQAHWLGVKIAGQAEQSRVFLVSVPYAMKAGDAATIGGLPASAFVLAAPSNASSSTVSHTSAASNSGNSPSVSGTGKTDYIPLWTNTTGGLGDSVLFQSGTKIGVNTLTPAATLDVKGNVNSSSGFDLGGKPFAFGSYANQNVFLGFAGNTTLSEGFNTGVGFGALAAVTTGNSNTATGYGALSPNTTGNANTANGSGALGSNTAGAENTATGGGALGSNTSGSNNTATGALALRSNTTGSANTAAGYQALEANTTGGANTAAGYQALEANTTGGANAAYGAAALESNNAGADNTATGGGALSSNTSGSNNTATGAGALGFNTTGQDNTAVGYEALFFNTQNNQTAVGYAALHSNTTGGGNVASGYEALYSNTTGPDNTANGYQALFSSINAGGNTASGYQALYFTNMAGGNTGYDNVADGYAALYANTTGTENTAVGFNACTSNTTGSDLSCFGFNSTAADGLTNATAIGAHAFVGQSNSLVLGGTGDHAVKVGIGTTAPSSILTIGRGAGHPVSDSWETYSSRRWKKNIQTLPDALAKVEQLRGVSYDLKDSSKHEIGVIAEEVGQVVPEVVSYEKNGKDATGVDYSRLTALLIEAVKQQQTQIVAQQKQIALQRSQIRKQQRLTRAQQLQISTQGRLMTAQQKEIAGLSRKVGVLESSLRTAQPDKLAVLALK